MTQRIKVRVSFMEDYREQVTLEQAVDLPVGTTYATGAEFARQIEGMVRTTLEAILATEQRQIQPLRASTPGAEEPDNVVALPSVPEDAPLPF